MRRRLFTLLSAASLALCMATCGLWVWLAYAGPGGRPLVLPAEPPDDGFLLRLDRSGVTVLRTPPPGPGDAAARKAMASLVRGAHFVFGLRRWGEPGRPEGSPFTTYTFDYIVSRSSTRLPPAAIARPLLDALDDPATFLAAHAVLTYRFEPGQSKVQDVKVAAPGADEATGTLNGLPVAVRRDGPYGPMATFPADPAQAPAVRAYWHARLGRPVTTVPYWAVTLASVALPGLWAVRRFGRVVARRRRRLDGRCPSCGYDLRGNTSGICPECGNSRLDAGLGGHSAPADA